MLSETEFKTEIAKEAAAAAAIKKYSGWFTEEDQTHENVGQLGQRCDRCLRRGQVRKGHAENALNGSKADKAVTTR